MNTLFLKLLNQQNITGRHVYLCVFKRSLFTLPELPVVRKQQGVLILIESGTEKNIQSTFKRYNRKLLSSLFSGLLKDKFTIDGSKLGDEI